MFGLVHEWTCLKYRSTSEIRTKTYRSISRYVMHCTKQSGRTIETFLKELIIEWSVAWYCHYWYMSCVVLWFNDIVLWNKLSDYVHILFIFLFIIFLRRWAVSTFCADECFKKMQATIIFTSCSILMFVSIFSQIDNCLFFDSFISSHSDEKKYNRTVFQIET